MASETPSTFPSELNGSGGTTPTVNDDMAAIFGSGVRAGDRGTVIASKTPDRSRWSRRFIVSASGAALVAVAAVGILAGRDAVGTVATASTASASYKAPQIAKSKSPWADVETPSPVNNGAPPLQQLAPTLDAPPVFEQSDRPSAVRQGEGEAAALHRAPVSSMEQHSDNVASTRTSDHPGPTATTIADVATPAPPAADRRTACDNDNDSDACIALRLGVAERRVTNAYAQAIASGVRPRVLRDYERETNRARRVSGDDPGYALHLYSMITSDLNSLAEDAEARTGLNDQ